MKEFLCYIESPDGAFVEKSNSDRLKKIHACVNRIKSSEEVGVKYMQKWLDQIDFFEDGWEQGLEKGMAQGMAQGIEKGRLENTLSTLHKLMQKQHMSLNEALDFLEIPEAERQTYKEMMN